MGANFWKPFRTGGTSDVLLRIAFILSLSILAGIGFLSYHSLREFIDTAEQVGNSHALIERLDDLTVEVGDVESASRGFVLAGEDFYLEPYYSALKKVDQSLNSIRKLSPATPVQQALVHNIEVLCATKLDHSQQMVQLRKAAGFNAASQLFLTGEGYAMMDNLRDGINELKSIASRALKERTAAAGLRARNAIRALFLGTLLSFSLLSLVYYELHREIIRRRISEAPHRGAHCPSCRTQYGIGEAERRSRPRKSSQERISGADEP
jgi:CHASE3 domain sensor protein